MPTILVIDDEDDTRHMVRLMLTRQGYTVLEEGDAQTGIATARRQHPDLILMDISMPLLDGWTATRVLKSDPALAHIPIVAWTALNVGGERGACAAGYDGYIPKPINMAQFAEQIAALLRKYPKPEQPSPIAPEPTIPRPKPIITQEEMVNAGLLLLLGDTAVRQLAHQHLSGWGFRQLLDAADISSALKITRARRIDLILLDLDLNIPESLKALQQLQFEAHLETAAIMVIADLKVTQPAVLSQLGLSSEDYILKPVDWERLPARVASRLRIKLLEDKLRRRQTDLEVLYRASQVLGASLDPSIVLALILEQATASVAATQGSLYILNAQLEPIQQLHTSGLLDASPADLQAMFARGVSKHDYSFMSPAIVSNTLENPHWLRLKNDTHTCSSLIVPLVGREGVMGLLALDHDQVDHFAAEHITWLVALMAQAAVSLDNARLFEGVRDERKKLSVILDSSTDAIVVASSDMRLTLINEAAKRVLGLRATKVGYPIQDILGTTHPLLPLLNLVKEQKDPISQELEIDNIIYHVTVKPVAGIGYVAALHDIHWLKELEKIELNRQRQETERVKREFARHFSPQVVELLLTRGETLTALRKCQAAMLFSDLRNYTSLTERIGMEAMMEYVLKRYITVMTDMIYAHEGTINKVLGDGIMAVFGVPIAQPNAPQRALRSALAMQRAMAMLREGWLRDLGQDISLGIGLAWGEVIAGDIGGSSQRVDYTVVGDAVNLAARLGEIAGPGEVLLTHALAEAVGSNTAEWRLEELPPRMIKGKEHPQRFYRAALPV